MPDAVTVTVRYFFKPGMEVIGKQALCEFVAENRAAPGCQGIVLHRDRKNPASFLTISHWDSIDQFMELLAQPRIKETAEQAKRILARPFEVEIWTPLEQNVCD